MTSGITADKTYKSFKQCPAASAAFPNNAGTAAGNKDQVLAALKAYVYGSGLTPAAITFDQGVLKIQIDAGATMSLYYLVTGVRLLSPAFSAPGSDPANIDGVHGSASAAPGTPQAARAARLE